ncbi:MAG: hypothetical protein ACQEVA_20540, partial [Myxococcota bacterium]
MTIRLVKRAFLAACIALVTLCFALDTSAIDDPSLDYHTIETPHFYVHYYTGQRDFAWRVARIHEEAH